jgi:glycosyltransferase involved in cell wall biosynthesis
MDPIDVVMLTKNSDDILKECLTSIYENVPVKRLIVVDASSTDNTLKIMNELNEQHGHVEIITENGSRAKARERGIQEVETEWFMFVDSDVILCKDWFKKAEKCIRDDVGAVWGVNIDVIPNVKNRFFIKSLILVARESFNLRGGMHDTLIRRKLVEDIKIPEKLHSFEDAYIVNWIKKKGYEAAIGGNIYCLHYRPIEDWNFKESLALATLEIKCGVFYCHIFRYTFYYPFFILYWLLQLYNKNFGDLMSQKGKPKVIRQRSR